MKKFIMILAGIDIGVALILGVFIILNMNSTKGAAVENSTIIQEAETDNAEIEHKVGAEAATLPLKTILGLNDEIDYTEAPTYSEEDTMEASAKYGKRPYYIKVNRLSNCVTVYALDADGNYTIPFKAMACSVGKDWATPLGVFKISNKYEWRLLFGDSYGQYSVRFNGHILFHSVPYEIPSNSRLKEGEFNLLGEPASQGCIRLCVADVKWIYDNCLSGTVVEVYDSENPGPLGKPVMQKVNPESPYSGWDPTDPDPRNPWLSSELTIYGVKDRTVKIGKTIDLLEGISATDVDGLPVDVRVIGKVDFNTAGTYKVVYSSTSVYGETITEYAAITVE